MRIIIFLLLLNSNLVFCQSFSIESIINNYHCKNKALSTKLYNYTNERLHNMLDSLMERGLYRNQNISIKIPDDLAGNFFTIQKGEIVTQIYKNEIVGYDIINGYESVMDGNGNITHYFLLEELKNRHNDWYDIREKPNQMYYYFYVIGTKDVKIKPQINIINDINEDHFVKILKAIENEMENNNRFKNYLMKLPNITSPDTIRARLSQYCEFKVFQYKIENDSNIEYIIQIESKNRKKAFMWNFSVIIFSNHRIPVLIPFSFFEVAFKTNNKSYFLFRSFGPETGARGRNLYTYDQSTKQLEFVFSDWTWSD